MIYDISPPISSALPVWPGDTPPAREILLDMTRGDHLTLSSLRTTVHVGAHADAPSHYGADAAAIHEADLELYMGRCRVIPVEVNRSGLIGPELLAGELEQRRILLATGTYPDPHCFSEDFAALAPPLIDALADAGVELIGVDTPSVDPFTSTQLPAHRRCLARNVKILEGLVLSGVPAGVYELIALPLKLVGFDASPVRAVLRTID